MGGQMGTQKVIAYIELDKDAGLALIKADSLKPCSMFDGYAVLYNVTGIAEASHPRFEVQKMRVKKEMVQYILEGVEKDIEEFTKEKIEEQNKAKAESTRAESGKIKPVEIEQTELSNFP